VTRTEEVVLKPTRFTSRVSFLPQKSVETDMVFFPVGLIISMKNYLSWENTRYLRSRFDIKYPPSSQLNYGFIIAYFSGVF
jgi:hypothetical protein